MRALLDSGCGRIACSVYERHMLEPNHPVLSGYDYALRLRGSRYRHVIPIPNRNENYPLGELFREAYRRNPFDGLSQLKQMQLFVPQEAIKAYQADECWGKFAEILPIE